MDNIEYKLEWSINESSVGSIDLPGSRTSYTIEGLMSDTEYRLTISAVNMQSGKQSFSVSETVRTLVAGTVTIL